MLLNIIFSYNRAIQLDYLLKSTINHFKLDYKIIVIYHTSGNHELGYKKLILDYSKYDFISFIERNQIKINPIKEFFFKILKKKITKKDDFKSIVEKCLNYNDFEFVMFNTDDGVWKNDFFLEYDIINLIRRNPFNATYRLYIGENLKGFPNYVKRWGNYYLWDYYYQEQLSHWTFPFAVDGTVYHTKALLSILENVEYYNPVTLEDYVVNYVKKNNFFSIGIGPVFSSLVCTKLNRVSIETKNPTIHISVDVLNDYFLDGYELKLYLPKLIDNANIVPLKVSVISDTEEIFIYELDEYGLKVQNNLGIEGAKIQMD